MVEKVVKIKVIALALGWCEAYVRVRNVLKDKLPGGHLLEIKELLNA